MARTGASSTRRCQALSGRATSRVTSLIATTIFSALPYKTPWNVLPFYVVAIVLAGVGLSWLVHVTSSRVWRSARRVGLRSWPQRNWDGRPGARR